MWQEYKAFLVRGNLVELATAFVLGLAFNAVIQALANDVVLGTIAGLIGIDSIMELTIGPVLVGTFLGALLSFGIVATVLFFVLRGAARLRRRTAGRGEEAVEPPPEPDDVLLLREIRDLLAERR
ncbi:MAG: large conductance mechanosensitive channel protein MscL [Actinomycetota bacterium]